MTHQSYSQLIIHRKEREQALREHLMVEVERAIKETLDKEEDVVHRQELLTSIHQTGQHVIRFHFEEATLQATSTDSQNAHLQPCLLLFSEAEHVDGEHYTALGGGLSLMGGKRPLSFFLAADGEVYYGYVAPYEPVRLTHWSVHKLWLGASVDTSRFAWALEKLLELVLPSATNL